MKPFLVGVAGGSGSGKTTVVNMIRERYPASRPANRMAVIREDHYYHDLSHLSSEELTGVNFDHPDSLDSELMIEHLSALANGESIYRPSYDFKTRQRTEKAELIEPVSVVFFEGILSLHHKDLADLFSLKLFIDVDADLRILRRLGRDVRERGRRVDGVISQYLDTVRPSYQEFIEPTKHIADEIIDWEVRCPKTIERIISLLP